MGLEKKILIVSSQEPTARDIVSYLSDKYETTWVDGEPVKDPPPGVNCKCVPTSEALSFLSSHQFDAVLVCSEKSHEWAVAACKERSPTIYCLAKSQGGFFTCRGAASAHFVVPSEEGRRAILDLEIEKVSVLPRFVETRTMPKVPSKIVLRNKRGEINWTKFSVMLSGGPDVAQIILDLPFINFVTSYYDYGFPNVYRCTEEQFDQCMSRCHMFVYMEDNDYVPIRAYKALFLGRDVACFISSAMARELSGTAYVLAGSHNVVLRQFLAKWSYSFDPNMNNAYRHLVMKNYSAKQNLPKLEAIIASVISRRLFV